MKKKKTIIALVVAVFIIFILSQTAFKGEKLNYTKEEVKTGTIVQEVAETGTVKKGENVNLSFQAGGQIENIYVTTGETVNAGNPLVKLNSNQLSIKYNQAQASLDAAKAQLQVAQTLSANYQNTLASEEQNLADASTTAQENLNNAYQDAINDLDDAYLKIYNALDLVKTIQPLYFYKNDQESLAVLDNKEVMTNSLAALKTAVGLAKVSLKNSDIDAAISVAKKSLEDTSLALTVIRQTCDDSLYRDAVSSTYKSSLDTHRENINTALSAIVSTQQTISSTKIANDTSLNAAANRVTNAQGNLKKAQDDIVLYQAQQAQAAANLQLLQSQLNDTIIYAPTDGQVVDITKKEGEIAQASEPVVSFITNGSYQISVDIYEEDVVKVKLGDSVDIKLTAFPDQAFSGKVILINPSEKLIDGVVYYEVKIDFPEAPQETRIGMTADIVIKTAQKDNVLIVSESAITKKDNKTFVQVIKDDKQEQREVIIGLKGGDGNVEVVSGLEAGEFIAIAQ